MNKTYLKLSLDLDFVLIAITTSLKDYTLCHKINTSLDFNFEKTDDHEVYFNIGKPPLSFSKYLYFTEDSETEYYIVNNKNAEGFLIPEMNKADFFMIIYQYIDEEDIALILSALNKLPDIQVAVQVNPSKLKSSQNLIM